MAGPPPLVLLLLVGLLLAGARARYSGNNGADGLDGNPTCEQGNALREESSPPAGEYCELLVAKLNYAATVGDFDRECLGVSGKWCSRECSRLSGMFGDRNGKNSAKYRLSIEACLGCVNDFRCEPERDGEAPAAASAAEVEARRCGSEACPGPDFPPRLALAAAGKPQPPMTVAELEEAVLFEKSMVQMLEKRVAGMQQRFKEQVDGGPTVAAREVPKAKRKKHPRTAAPPAAKKAARVRRERKLRGDLVDLLLREDEIMAALGIKVKKKKKPPPVRWVLRVRQWNVGNADAAVVRFTPLEFMIDAGNSASGVFTRQVANHLSAMVLTHGHRDHKGGAASTLNRFPVNTVEYLVEGLLVNANAYNAANAAMVARHAGAGGGISGMARNEWYASPVFDLPTGDPAVAPTEHLTYYILSPNSALNAADENELSLVIGLHVYSDDGNLNRRLVFTGDAPPAVQQDFLNRFRAALGGGGPFVIDYLKISHHGSNENTPAAARPGPVCTSPADVAYDPAGTPDEVFMNNFECRFGVISASGRYNHPCPQAEQFYRHWCDIVQLTGRDSNFVGNAAAYGFDADLARGDLHGKGHIFYDVASDGQAFYMNELNNAYDAVDDAHVEAD